MNRDFMNSTKVVLWDTTLESEHLIELMKKEIENETNADKIAELENKIQELQAGISSLKSLSLELENTVNDQSLKIAEFKNELVNSEEKVTLEENMELTEDIKDDSEIAIEPEVENAEEVEEAVVETPAEEVVQDIPLEEKTPEGIEEPVVEEPKESVELELPVVEEKKEEPVVEEPKESVELELPVVEEKKEEAPVEAVVETPVEEPVQAVQVEEPVVETTVEAPAEDKQEETQVTYEKQGVTEDRGVLVSTSQAEKARASFDNQNVLQAEIARNNTENVQTEAQPVAEQPVIPTITETPMTSEQELEKMTQEYTEALTSGNEEKANELSNAISEKKKVLQAA